MAYKRSQILLCGGTGCTSSGSMVLEKEFQKELTKHDLLDEIEIVVTGCFGLCELGPVVIIYPEGTFYSRVEPSDISELVEEHLVKGRPLERLIYSEKKEGEHPLSINELGFYKKQKRIALSNCGVIDPEDIEEYIAFDGYLALEKALFKMTPQAVIDEIKASGLRGRGGGGFPTGLKWQFAANAVSPDGVKYVACNADEGDPGAFMDRSVLEGDPHRIIEAMALAAYAIGAQKGYVYIRAEYPI
ncbi:MAG: NAD(P)H-dependent oxidoreductase subunit E, partial [Eubacterium sp.]